MGGTGFDAYANDFLAFTKSIFFLFKIHLAIMLLMEAQTNA